RCALAEMLVRLGRADFDDAATMPAVLGELETVIRFCEEHIETEEHFLRPACEGRVAVHAFDTGHPGHVRFIAELRAMVKAFDTTPPERRQEAGRTLYLHFASFVGDSMLHMAEEESVLLPLLHRAFTDEELLALHGKIMASFSPADLARTM